ncbi:tautomerase family protein [Chitinophaga nivalis]|uniref:Tautomerase family protein n=1 Tax=Chitinophaga nivalis TaxID=2991709 RepID=A0ABT3IGH5_9BACT|nr:tautomerase family protein [Chitinophaga nivalis]MCW3467231.1 tautomerase family protein [Chitinophaga nivalis]MCW3483077.1 tautomerase family protein [Chitinophaga nivalis]
MPFIQIYLGDHLTEKNKTDISSAVHNSLVAVFKIPVDDYFHVIHTLPPGSIRYPASYMNVPHSHQQVYIRITARDGRTVAMKKELYQQIAAGIAASTPVPASDVFIVLVETAAENWSFGNGLAQMVP